ncbi:MAG: hypothetical protein IPP01_14510 [Saprospiraceae bacterium]|nr:hypothetical protein [Saprospiraceae bacterium]
MQIVSKSTPIYTTRYDTIITQSGTVFYIKKSTQHFLLAMTPFVQERL